MSIPINQHLPATRRVLPVWHGLLVQLYNRTAVQLEAADQTHHQVDHTGVEAQAALLLRVRSWQCQTGYAWQQH